ncbi:MAG: Tol-Pal system beta propeller repeat protein TolB [Deltaproteobacteria bacterium]|nr:Tol-Pal system beta propeller repeat protein TolB [Deltaproteobacteria bacterium]
MKKKLLTIVASLLFLFPSTSIAGDKVYLNIDSPAGKLLPLAIQVFHEGGNPKITQEVLDALYDDTDFTGIFDIIEEEAYLEAPSASLKPKDINYQDWRIIGTEILIKGKVKVSGDRTTVELRLFDVINETQLVAKRYVGATDNPRALAHRFSDELIKKLTGTKGVFSTKLLFISKRSGAKEIFISDYDGKNHRNLTKNDSINLSPKWSPNGNEVLFTSYAAGNPGVYRLDIRKDNKIYPVSTRAGINIGGRWHPDGKTISLTISGRKSPEIYFIDLKSNVYTRLTNNFAIDISASWSPDGKKLVYVSDRTGNPQIYVLNLDGGVPTRITYQGKYNTDPVWSPDGETIAYTSVSGSNFDISTIRADGTGNIKLTSRGVNKTPSWSPDGRYIVFSSDRDYPGKESLLYIMRSDGRSVKAIHTGADSESAPAWSPYFE